MSINYVRESDKETEEAIETAVEAIETAIVFSGTPYSLQITSTNTPARFLATAKKLKDVVIRNSHASNAVDIGLYVNAVPADLRAASIELSGGASIGFTLVDLNQLAVVASVDAAYSVVHVLGVEV